MYEDLRNIENLLERKGYDIARFEILKDADRTGGLDDPPAQRAVGENPFKALEDWDSEDSENYIIEVFFSNSLDRAIYNPEVGKIEYIKFSASDNLGKEFLEE